MKRLWGKGKLLHLLDATVDFPCLACEFFSDVLDQSPCQHVCWGTLNANRGDDLAAVSMELGKLILDTYDCAVALGLFMVFVDDQLDPWGLSSPVRVNDCPWKSEENINLRINVVGAMRSTGLNHRSRVQVVGANAIDDKSSLLRQLVQLGRVELDSKDIYCMNKVRSHSTNKKRMSQDHWGSCCCTIPG